MAAAVDNGVNVGALLEAREALRKMPEAAKFTWRATCKWKKGTRSRTYIQNFFGLGQEQKHRTESNQCPQSDHCQPAQFLHPQMLRSRSLKQGPKDLTTFSRDGHSCNSKSIRRKSRNRSRLAGASRINRPWFADPHHFASRRSGSARQT